MGETHHIDGRLKKHNLHTYNRGFTKITNDWKLVLGYPCPSKEDALYLERFIKRMKSKKFILKIIDSPNILSDI
ncbi:MAG: GIY-YIG nuclease family protein [Gelidibacter sp.]